MNDPTDNSSPEQKSQLDYNQKVELLRGLLGDDHLTIEITAHDQLGDNSLKLLTNHFGPYNAGWIDDIEFDESIRDRLIAFTRQESVSTNAVAKSILRSAYETNTRLKTIQWLLIGLMLLAIGVLMVLLVR